MSFFTCFVLLCSSIFKEVLSRGTVCFEILLELFYILKCKAFVCNWPLCHHLRSSSTLKSLVGCYVSFAFLVLLGGIVVREVLSGGTVCFETLLKLFYSPKCTAFVCNWPLCCPLQFQWNKASFDKWFRQDLVYIPV